ncbi:MAG: cytochrome d ubiquinol oxidase subunit II [Solirubrobacteraceae bacterium]
MTLEIFWFCAIAVLWGGYFALEGFDFGVGMLLPFLARDERDRRGMLATIGPHWDGNEVWLVIAAGATFAAFPAWYATMFSGFYLVLVLILVLLIVRVLSFEWRERADDRRWLGGWRWANTIASFGAPFLWGVALANLLHGVPLDGDGDFSGNVLDLFNAYTVAAGVAVTLLFALHGATFLALRTEGGLRDRSRAAARRLAAPAALVVAAFLAWTVQVAVDRNDRDLVPVLIPALIGAAALALGLVTALRGRSGWAFTASTLSALALVATLFSALYPYVIVSDPDIGNSLTVSGAATAHYALSVITVVAAVVLPVMMLYQGWTYHVFRTRVRPAQDPPG